MNNTVTFKDILKEGFFGSAIMNRININSVLFDLLITLAVSMFIFYIYRKNSKGSTYSLSYNIVLVIMALITSMVIITISSNVVLSLGMVGALSIIRFRTPIKDPMDIVFMFWAIAIGITSGAGLHLVSVIGSLFVGIVIIAFKKVTNNFDAFLLIIKFEKDKESIVLDELKKVKYSLKSKNIIGEFVEFSAEINLKNNDTAFMDGISKISGVDKTMLIRAGNGNEF